MKIFHISDFLYVLVFMSFKLRLGMGESITHTVVDGTLWAQGRIVSSSFAFFFALVVAHGSECHSSISRGWASSGSIISLSLTYGSIIMVFFWLVPEGRAIFNYVDWPSIWWTHRRGTPLFNLIHRMSDGCVYLVTNFIDSLSTVEPCFDYFISLEEEVKLGGKFLVLGGQNLNVSVESFNFLLSIVRDITLSVILTFHNLELTFSLSEIIRKITITNRNIILIDLKIFLLVYRIVLCFVQAILRFSEFSIWFFKVTNFIIKIFDLILKCNDLIVFLVKIFCNFLNFLAFTLF